MIKSRLENYYKNVICEDYIVLYNLKNIFLFPTFEKSIVLSTANSFVTNEESRAKALKALFLYTNLRALPIKARKSISSFALRENDCIGLKVCLRKQLLFCFLDKIFFWVVPNITPLSETDTLLPHQYRFKDHKPEQSQQNKLSFLTTVPCTEKLEPRFYSLCTSISSLPSLDQDIVARTVSSISLLCALADGESFPDFRFELGSKFELFSKFERSSKPVGSSLPVREKRCSMGFRTKFETRRHTFTIPYKNLLSFLEPSLLPILFEDLPGAAFSCLSSIPKGKVNILGFLFGEKVKIYANRLQHSIKDSPFMVDLSYWENVKGVPGLEQSSNRAKKNGGLLFAPSLSFSKQLAFLLSFSFFIRALPQSLDRANCESIKRIVFAQLYALHEKRIILKSREIIVVLQLMSQLKDDLALYEKQRQFLSAFQFKV